MSTWLFTLEATTFSTEQLRAWLIAGKVYTNLVPDLLKISIPEDAQHHDLVSGSVVTRSFNQTFTAQYVYAQTVRVLDASFAWASGDSTKITFSNVIAQKTDEFESRMATTLSPSIAALPSCQGAPYQLHTLACRPSDESSLQFARMVVAKGLTDKNNAEPNQRHVYQSILDERASHESMWFYDIETTRPMAKYDLLGSLAVGLGCLVIVACMARDKSAAFSRIGKWASYSSLFMLTVAAYILYIAHDPTKLRSFRLDGANGATDTLLEPFVQQVLRSVGITLLLLDSSVAIIGLALQYGLPMASKRSPRNPH